MSKLTWDQTGEHLYETGVEKAVLYPYSNGAYQKGVAWNGITNISEKPSGAETTSLYADNIKYLNLQSNEEFGATIEAYTYPDEFAECDGSAEIADGVVIGQQKRKPFALSYITKVGNDVDGADYGETAHIVYGCMAKPTEKGHDTINETPEAITLSWEITTTPVPVTGFKPTSHITISKRKVSSSAWTALLNALHGSENSEPTLQMPSDLITMFRSNGTVSTP